MRHVLSPNDRGRANEAIFVDTLSSGLGVPLTSRAVSQARRDAPKISELGPQTHRSLKQASELVRDWHLSTFGQKFSRIDRSDDASPGTADVICEGTEPVKYSLKLNHDATKHPRPYSLAQWMDLAKGCQEDNEHRSLLAEACRIFRSRIGSATQFKSVPQATKKLYDSVVVVCADNLNEWCPRLSLADELFTFLVGEGFVKVITELKSRGDLSRVRIERFDKPARPRAVIAKPRPKGYLDLEFSNGWVLELRLHSAKSNIKTRGQVDLKFDSKAVKSPGLQIEVLMPS